MIFVHRTTNETKRTAATVKATATTNDTSVLVADSERNSPKHEGVNLTFGGTTEGLYGPEFTANSAHTKRIRKLRYSKRAFYEELEGVDEQAWYATYGSTTALLSLVHAFYLRRVWGTGKGPRRRHSRSRSRQTAMASYHEVVHRKQFHLLIGAILNHHPNPEPSTSSTRSRPPERIRSDVPAGNHSEELASSTSSDPFSLLQWSTLLSEPLHSSPTSWLTFLNSGLFRTGNVLHGLPLLFYCSHCLWACRALEVIYCDAHYARVLWTLTLTAFFVDFAVTRMALGVIREMNFATSAPFAMGVSLWTSGDNDNNGDSSTTIASRVERILTHRNIGSLTATTAAVLFLFQDKFDAPIPVLPFLSTKGPILGTPVVSWIMVVAVLMRLSQSTHPVMGVACGTVSGVLWVSGWTFWLAEPYWSCGMLMICLVLCVLSLKLNGNIYLPCIDYSPWNRDGYFVHRQEELIETLMRSYQANDDSSSHTQSSRGDHDEEDVEEDAIEFGILSRRQQSDRPFSGSSATFLTGRSERHHDVEADAENAPSVPASMTMRSRRAPGSGRR